MKTGSDRKKRPITARTPPAMLAARAEPLVGYQTYKLRRATIDMLARVAGEKGWSTAALVRDILDGWASRHG